MSESKRKPKGKQPGKNVQPAPASELAAKVTRSVQDVAAKASKRAAEGLAQAQAAAGQTVQSVRDEVESVRDEARQSFSRGRQAALDWERGIENKIRSRPLVALLFAGAIGFLISIVLFGGSSRNRRC